MPYNPSLPANNSPIVAAELRDQFAGLKDLLEGELQNLGDVVADQATNLVPAINANASGPVSSLSAPNFTISNPPTQAQVQAIADYLGDLYVALSRT